jgi:branched-chain amino acid aminotransferase
LQWDDGVVRFKPTLDIHIMASVFHYGQALFEGLKAFECKDKHVRFFQPGNNFNSLRLNRGCARLMMPEVPLEMFNAAVKKV